MIDFNKITSTELNELKQIASKAAEKSDLERIYLFSSLAYDRARNFVFCHRFLINMYNLLDTGDVRKAIKESITETQTIYLRLLELIRYEEKDMRFNNNKRQKEMAILTRKDSVNELIDLFSVLIEKAHVLQMSKLKGIIMEGKSGEAYKKVFGKTEQKP